MPLLRRLFPLLALLAFSLLAHGADPVYVGFDAELGHRSSTSDDAVKEGILIAIDEINAAGGVLGGRPLELLERDNRSVPARGIANIRQFATIPDLVAVFCGKFSPVVLEELPLLHEKKMLLMDPWAAADRITDNGYQPNFAFRLSLRDSWAVPAMMAHAQRKGASQVGLLLPNTSWGRSNQKAMERYLAGDHQVRLVATRWYNWGDNSLMEPYVALRDAGAQAIILVANEREGSILVKEVAQLPTAERLPLISHWGVTGGDFVQLAGPALQAVDFSVVQTYSFIGDERPAAKRVVAAEQRLFHIPSADAILSPVGVAHAYDLTHLLAIAIDKAGSTDRSRVRDALEHLPPYHGLIKDYPVPFTAQRHDALAPEDVFMARYRADGVLAPIR